MEKIKRILWTMAAVICLFTTIAFGEGEDEYDKTTFAKELEVWPENEFESSNCIKTVSYGTQEIELHVSSNNENAVLTYTWYVCDKDKMPVGDPIGSGTSSCTCSFTKNTVFLCKVTDTDGASRNLFFDIRIKNITALYPDKVVTPCRFRAEDTCYFAAVPETPFTLKIVVEAEDPAGLSYVWTDLYSDQTVAEGTDSIDVKYGSKVGDISCYACTVKDRFGNEESLGFMLTVVEETPSSPDDPEGKDEPKDKDDPKESGDGSSSDPGEKIKEPENPVKTPAAVDETKKEVTAAQAQKTFKLNLTNGAKNIPLQLKKKNSKIQAMSLADGDELKTAVSSDTKAVTVSIKGRTVVLTGKKAKATAKITVKTKFGAVFKFSVKVQSGKVATKKIKTAKKKVTLTVGDTYDLGMVITPVTTTDKLSIKSSKEKIASVSKKGIVKAKKAGKTTITIKSGSVKKTVVVTVKKK